MKKVKFALVKVGQRFSLSSFMDDIQNIKVLPSRLETAHPSSVPFNAIRLIDGKPRTFDSQTEVFVKL